MSFAAFATRAAAAALAAAIVAPSLDAGEPRRPRRVVDDERLAERLAATAGTTDTGAPEVAAGSALSEALGWLATEQNPSGSWGTSFEFADTATAVWTLGQAQPAGEPFHLGANWLTGNAAADNDELARQILALDAVTGFDVADLVESLLDSRNAAETNAAAPNYPEGGWGLAAGFETDSLTSALALWALEAAGRKAGIGEVAEPLAAGTTNVHPWVIATDATKARIRITVAGSTVRLRMKQGAPPPPTDPFFSLPPGTFEIVFPDSGLPFTPGANYISVQSTGPAASYTFTASYQTPDFDTRAFAEALAYLRAAQNPDGGWGIQIDEPTSFYTTVHVILALQRWQDYDFDAELANGIAFLLAEQLGDGSFGVGGTGIPYQTALAALALMRHEICPFSADTESAIVALLGQQELDGSWVAEPYDTALALRALWEYDEDGDGIFQDGDCSGVAGDNPCALGETTGCDDNCADFFNVGQAPVVFGQTILAADKNSLTWPQPVDIAWVKGNLADVDGYGVIAGGGASFTTTLSMFGDLPSAGNGLYYLVRLAGDCSVLSWQSTWGAEPGRDSAALGEVAVEITSPANGSVLTASPVTVSGTVDGAEPVSVTVNGVAATIGSGTFSASVPLVRGANTITAQATDAASFTGSDQISVTKVDHSIPHGGSVTASRIFTAASSTLDQVAFYTVSQSGVPPGVVYTTLSVSRISATEMRVTFKIDVTGAAASGLHAFTVTYGLLDAGMNPLGPLTGNVFEFLIQVP